MKSERLELRLTPELRRKLNELTALSGTSASRLVRKLILAAHRDAFGSGRALGADPPAGPPAVVQAVAVTSPATGEEDPYASMSTDEILILAGVELPVRVAEDRPTEASC